LFILNKLWSLIMQFSPTFCHFICLWSKYSQHRSQTVRDHVSHLYKITGKIIVFIF
jgi:hypothetical protein